jgi:hypothetical protein
MGLSDFTLGGNDLRVILSVIAAITSNRPSDVRRLRLDRSQKDGDNRIAEANALRRYQIAMARRLLILGVSGGIVGNPDDINQE